MSDPEFLDRRNFFSRVAMALATAVGSTLAVIIGGSILSPSFAKRPESWLPAGAMDDLEPGVPTPITVRVERQDGYYRTIDRHVVFLLRTDDEQVRALSSVCTHLGCRVSWNARDKALKCPCHGGVFDARGRVAGGPPPRPLIDIPTKLDGNNVLVQL